NPPTGRTAPSGTPCHALDLGARERVATLVQRITRMAGNLDPIDVVNLGEADELFPEWAVGDRRFVAAHPAVARPRVVPALSKAVHQVGTVAVQAHATRTPERSQRLDGRGELHLLVRRVGLAARDFALVLTVPEHRCPSAGAGISRSCPVRIDDDFRADFLFLFQPG